MNKKENHYSFLAIGQTQESREAGEGSFKRYVGLAGSYILAVNPTKKELDELRGFESQSEPEYVKDTDEGKEVHIHFVVKTDPATNNGIEMTNLAMFTLRNSPAYSNDKSKVQVIDKYGNTTWADAEDAKNHKQLPETSKIDQKTYRMAAVGEADLVAFLKTYLGVPSSLDYINGAWVKKEDADEKGLFELEHIKDYFKGDFSELKDALKLQPNNKIKLLYGVRTADGKQFQTVAAREGLFIYNSAGSKAYEKMEKRLADMKARGSFANTEYKVQELQEWTVQPTNLETPAEAAEEAPFPDSLDNSEMPW